jgi:hypothetical protein
MTTNKPVPWALWWIFASAAHLLLCVVISPIVPVHPPRWFEYGLGLFVTIAERGVAEVIEYHGQDSIQWPLIIANSLTYGAILATVVTVLIAKAKKRPTNT